MKNVIFSPVNRTGELLLAAMPVETSAPVIPVRQPIHKIFAVDKSGSMYDTLGDLIEDLKQQVRQLQTGDAVTFAWFSSRRQNGFPIKAFRIVDESSFVELDRLFDEHKRAMNLTCFSEVLEEVGQVLKDTAFLNARTVFTFFSDGWANDASVTSEHARCREILKNLNGKFDLVLTVAYSDYADRDFLSEMAAIVGGVCIPSAYLKQVSEALSQMIRRAERSAPRVKIELGDFKPEFVFAVDRNPETGGITMYEPNEAGEIFFSPNATEKTDFLYFLTRDRMNLKAFLDSRPYTGLDLPGAIVDAGAEANEYFGAPIVTAAFAASVVLSQNGRQDDAIDVLGYLGDLRFVKTLGSAFTPTERANAEDEIRHAIFNDSGRWLAGRKFNCTPDPDAFCLLDFLNLLQSDESAQFHPRHPAFSYKRIGRGSIQRAGYPEFMPDAGASSPISDLVWNSEFLNLSIRARIAGTVELPDSVSVDTKGNLSPEGTTRLARPASLPKLFQTFQCRTYALIKDGFRNVERFPVSVSKETALALTKLGVFADVVTYDDSVLGVAELGKIPVINRRVAENTPTAMMLAKRVYADEVISAELKVFKALRLELDPRGEIVPKGKWTIEEMRFLSALGFSQDGSFSPPEDKAEATDKYEAVSFKIAVKGFSSQPKLSEVREKLKSGKTLNAPGQLMNVALKTFAEKTEHSSLPEKILWIDEQIGLLKKAQTANRLEIQKPKFAMILGHKSFADITLGAEPSEIKFDALGAELTAKISITKKTVAI